MGCSVTSAAKSGVVQREMKSPAMARVARYSGKYRPAWRINHTGGGQTGSPAKTRKKGLARLGSFSISMTLT
jgi:hypothetical protein